MAMEFVQGALAGVAGGAVGAGGAIWVWRAERSERRRTEIVTALHLFSASVDLLVAELRRLTPPGTVAKKLAEAIQARRTTVDWLASPLTERLSPRAFQLQDRYATAMNRLLAVAPQATLEVVERVNELIMAWTPVDEEWDGRWDGLRVQLSQHVRQVAGAQPPSSRAGQGGR